VAGVIVAVALAVAVVMWVLFVREPEFLTRYRPDTWSTDCCSGVSEMPSAATSAIPSSQFAEYLSVTGSRQ
jgi:hypothetical protein